MAITISGASRSERERIFTVSNRYSTEWRPVLDTYMRRCVVGAENRSFLTTIKLTRWRPSEVLCCACVCSLAANEVMRRCFGEVRPRNASPLYAVGIVSWRISRISKLAPHPARILFIVYADVLTVRVSLGVGQRLNGDGLSRAKCLPPQL